MNETIVHALAACCIALAAEAAAAAAASDAENDRLDAASREQGACSATASLLASACALEGGDDHLVARAKCLNVADARERAECQQQARTERGSKRSLCKAQFELRRAACKLLGEAGYDPAWEAGRFDADFRRLSNPNPYFPLGIGQRWVFLGEGERNTVEVIDATKAIEGVTCIVVRDLVYADGKLKEATDDWYAAARDGSTWYCGEEVKDYEVFRGDRPRRPELVSHDGSFKHGVERDKAGVIMPAQPKVGQVYLEEFSLANAEDISQILSIDYRFGGGGTLDRFVPGELAQRLCGNGDCVVTKNWSLLEPGAYALKYYARGIGFFLEIKPDEGTAIQLVECNFDARCASLPQPQVPRR